MSRIGKKLIEIPAGVKVTNVPGRVQVAGPLGNLELAVRPEIKVDVKGNAVHVERGDDSRLSRSLHGLTRTLIANMVAGVHSGFEKRLDIVGVGYKAEAAAGVVNLALGFSHPIRFELPKGISAVVDKQTSVVIKGADKQLVGQVAAQIRALRPPEPYKGKGIKYAGEIIRRKAGKAGKAASGGK